MVSRTCASVMTAVTLSLTCRSASRLSSPLQFSDLVLVTGIFT